MGIRYTASIKYEAQSVICEDVSRLFVVQNHLNWEKTTVTDRVQAMQRKAVWYSTSIVSCLA